MRYQKMQYERNQKIIGKSLNLCFVICNEEDDDCFDSVVCENDSVNPRKEILLMVNILNPNTSPVSKRIDILFTTIKIASY